MLKKLWMPLFFPIVVGCLSGLLMVAAMEMLPKYLGCFGFVAIAGLCAISGFVVMYFTGPRGLWYKPLLSCPVTFLFAYTFIDFFRLIAAGEIGGALFYFVACFISYGAGAFGFLLRKILDKRRAT